jgi:DNA topoisomerase IA
LIEAMQNAWRFVDDEVLRDRLKEAKGIGTPATRAEIIGGLKRQDFLTVQAKNIVPTATGLTLYGVLQQADPALVDLGVTAQLECLLDDVVLESRRWSAPSTPFATSPSELSASSSRVRLAVHRLCSPPRPVEARARQRRR